jgi:hypothetical protein
LGRRSALRQSGNDWIGRSLLDQEALTLHPR